MRLADLSHPRAAAFILSLTVAVLTTDLSLDLAGVAPWVEYTSLALLTSVLIAAAYARWVAARRRAESHKLDRLTLLRDAQEEERLRIARQLHDQMGQDLIGLSLMLKTLEPAVQTAEAGETLRQLATLTGDMDRRAHGIAWELRPSLPSVGGLRCTLENYVSDWSERFRIAVDFRCPGRAGHALPALVEATIFWVVQVAFTNILEHAAAKNVRLAVEHEADRLRVVIADDGRSLDRNAAMAPGQLRLIGIRERLTLIDGTLAIEAASPQRNDLDHHCSARERSEGLIVSDIGVVLVDDHPIVLAGIKALIHSAPELELVGEATNGTAALAVIREAMPDIAVVDLSIPGISGLELVRQVGKEQPAVKVLVLTLHDESVYVQHALEAGVRGYLVKRSAAEELIRAIRAIAAGGIYLDPAIAGKALRPITTHVSRSVALSDRESAVIKLIAQGFSNKEIARRLALSIKTAETYKARAAEKLGLRTRVRIPMMSAGHSD